MFYPQVRPSWAWLPATASFSETQARGGGGTVNRNFRKPLKGFLMCSAVNFIQGPSLSHSPLDAQRFAQSLA